MVKTVLRSTLVSAGLAASLIAGSAVAAPCTGVSLGTSATTDVTFAGLASDACVISTVNPQAGVNGDTSGFSGTFGGGWSLLGKVTGAGSNTLNGISFAWTFTEAASHTNGTWSLTTDKNATFDLVFAMHAANRSGAFLFDDQPTLANQLTNGTWQINWLNNGGNVPDFSNLTLFARDVVMTPVPEPETYALLLAGLATMTFVARRHKGRVHA